MAIAGHGIVMVPAFIVWEAIAAGNLVEVMGDLPEAFAGFCVHCPGWLIADGCAEGAHSREFGV